MRRATLIALLLLAACRQQPGFDERYGKAEEDIRARAAEMDNQLAAPAE